MKYLYLSINFFTILVPFLFSFHKKLKFHINFGSFLKASVLVALPFIAWDAIFTSMGIWGFNDDYVSGIKILGLPIEEILFFFCIPFSCVFTYHCLRIFFKMEWSKKWEQIIILSLVSFLLIVGFICIQQLYTSVTFISLGIVLLLLKYIFRVNWLPQLLTVYVILLIPFSIVNGILTGTGLEEPVVWYNEAHIIGIRILTIPFEDVFYGLALILLNVFFFTRFNKVTS